MKTTFTYNKDFKPDKHRIAADWKTQGFFVIERLLSDEECGFFKEEAVRVLENHARQGATVHVGCATVSEVFAQLAEHPLLLDTLMEVMPEGIEFMSDKIVYKKPGKSFATPLHIDAWYWKNTRPKVSVWIPMVDTTKENGTLTVVPGSHLREWSKVVHGGVNGGEFGVELAADHSGVVEAVACELHRGDAVVFSDRLLHGSTASEGVNERFAIIGTYHAPGHEAQDDQYSARKVLRPSAAAANSLQ
jgi:hypothetical protein